MDELSQQVSAWDAGQIDWLAGRSAGNADPYYLAGFRGRCACLCGGAAPSGRRYIPSHKYGHNDSFEISGDDLAIARFTGAADARNGRPRRRDPSDNRVESRRYTYGYDNPDAWIYE